jgi:hypothetical protein
MPVFVALKALHSLATFCLFTTFCLFILMAVTSYVTLITTVIAINLLVYSNKTTTQLAVTCHVSVLLAVVATRTIWSELTRGSPFLGVVSCFLVTFVVSRSFVFLAVFGDVAKALALIALGICSGWSFSPFDWFWMRR